MQSESFLKRRNLVFTVVVIKGYSAAPRALDTGVGFECDRYPCGQGAMSPDLNLSDMRWPVSRMTYWARGMGPEALITRFATYRGLCHHDLNRPTTKITQTVPCNPAIST